MYDMYQNIVGLNFRVLGKSLILGGGGGGYSWELLVGVCRPVLQILTIF